MDSVEKYKAGYFEEPMLKSTEPHDNLRDYRRWATAKLASGIKIGDSVYLWYHNILRIGTVVQLKPSKARLTFTLVTGEPSETWKKLDELRRYDRMSWYWANMPEPQSSAIQAIIMKLLHNTELEPDELKEIQSYVHTYVTNSTFVEPPDIDKILEMTQGTLLNYIADTLVGGYGIDPF